LILTSGESQLKVIQKLVDRGLVSITLFLIGAGYWYFFYFRGASAIAHADWVKEQVYLDTIRTSIETLRIPWAWASAFYHSVTLFMANPETVLTPDVFLLPFFSNNHFFYVHHLIFYGIGFWMVRRIAKEWQLTLPAYLLLYLLFNFNGYISSHMSEGHYQFVGYYLIPGVLYFLYKSNLDSAICRSDMIAGLLLGVLFANGSFHLAIWLSIFIGFLFVFDKRVRFKLILVLVVGYALGACRIVPALLYFPSISSKGLQSGYTDISLLLDSLTQLRGPGFGAATLLGWWEYSLYVGFTGLFLLIFGLGLFCRTALKDKRCNQQWAIALALMFLLSLGNTWGILATLQLPFGSIERTSSRFIVIPFLVCVMVATCAISNYLKRVDSRQLFIFFYILLGFIAIDLFYQLLNWSVAASELPSGGTKPIPKIEIVENVSLQYKYIVSLAWVFSGLAFVASCLYLKSLSTKQKK